MRPRVYGLRATFFALATALFATVFTPAVGVGQTATTISITNRSIELNHLLDAGREMERERRWGEALSHYEEALRRFPSDQSLHRRFDHARLHYDLARRYNDRTFRDRVMRLPLEQAMDLYGEVLLKVQTHYVEVPHFREFVTSGAEAFEIALREKNFADEHLGAVDGRGIDRFITEMRRLLAARTIETRLDASDAVNEIAELAKFRVGCPATAVVLEFLCGATNVLDAYSAYLTPGQLDEVYAQIEGNFVGLGIELRAEDGQLKIVRVIPGSPAAQAGMLAGDRIAAVDGQSTDELTTDEAANMLQGEEGSVARLTVVTPGEAPRRLAVPRRQVEVPSIDKISMLDPEHGVAYFRLNCFQKTTARDLDTALWRLHRQGMRRLILDLRGNPGGLLVTAVEVVDKFVDRGVIVSTRGRSSQEDYTYTANSAGTWRVPLVVLIDGDSASAAEIFAGAIRDHRRGTVVGEQSYGKGSVQGIFPLSIANTGIRLTTAKFYSPAGHPYSHVGVTPDVTVHASARPIHGQVSLRTSDSDPVLSAALQTARRLKMPR